MNLWNLGASLGIGGLIAIGFYKIAIVLINVWSKGDSERTKAISDGFTSITGSHAELIKEISNSNKETIAELNDHRRYIDDKISSIDSSVNALEVRVSTALDLTPVRGIQKADLEMTPPMSPASSQIVTTTTVAGVIQTRQDETQRSRPGPTERAKSQGGVVQSGSYFESRSVSIKKKPM